MPPASMLPREDVPCRSLSSDQVKLTPGIGLSSASYAATWNLCCAPTSMRAVEGLTSMRLGIAWIAASPDAEPERAVMRIVARPRTLTRPVELIEADDWFT